MNSLIEDDESKPKGRKLFGLVTMSCLFSVVAIELSGYGSPNSVVGKVVLCTEKVNAHLEGALNYIHHSSLMTASLDNDTYTYNTILYQRDRNIFLKQ